MYKMIIEIDGGIVIGVYTNSPESFQVEVTEPDDEHDEERKEARKRLEALMKEPEFHDVLCGEN